MIPQRRNFIKQATAITALAFLAPVMEVLLAEPAGKKHKVLLRSAWQTINIGDIGHTFGVMKLFERYLPEVEIILWPNTLDRGVDVLLQESFPKLTIIKDLRFKNGMSEELQKAFGECTLMLHNSGPYVAGYANLQAWWGQTRKPFGVYGVSLDVVSEELKELINHAAFFYCRDTESLRYLKSMSLRCPVQEFAPDATFAIDVHNDQRADAYLLKAGLKKAEFICVIPRLRYTPNWKIKGERATDEDKWRDEVSDLFKEKDALKFRQVIISWVKATGLKVLLCPEVTYQVEFSKETLFDPLPDEIKTNVVWRDSFWLPDEAASVYARSLALVSAEPHSPIIAIADGIPAIHVKQPSDTKKGQMWRDIGLQDWYFLIDETPAVQITAALLEIFHHYPAALAKVEKAKMFLEKVQKDNFKVIKRCLS